MRRRRRRRRHFGLWFFIFAVVAIAATTLFLIFRGAKVSGPDSANSSSVTKVIDTTPTQSSTKTTSGTFTADGSAKDPDGEKLKVRVYLQLMKNGHYRRELKIQGDTIRTIVDSGTYSGSKTYKLHSHNAVIFTYNSKNKQRQEIAKATSRYGDDYASYPSYLTKVLNNRVTKTTYHYVKTSLSFGSTTHTVPTISAAITAQTTGNASTESSDDSDTDNNDNDSTQSDADTNDDDQSSDDSDTQADAASSDSSSSKMTVDKAESIVEAQYPSDDYTITAMGQTGSNFTFVVINQDTHANKYVTVNGDGQLQ